MNIAARNIIFLLIKLLIYISMISVFVLLALSLADSNNSGKWLSYSGISVIIFAVLYILNVIRRKHLPVPGRDYL